MDIKITKSGETLSVHSPYNTEFVAGARKLAGKWDGGSKAWAFDARNEAAIRALLIETYGTDGSVIADTVSLRVTYDSNCYISAGGFELAGRRIATAFGRDSGARLGEGVVLEYGTFRSGGSVKNWRTETGVHGAIVLVHDIPRSAIEAIRNDSDITNIEIVEPTPTIDREALTAERERLLARLAEIDKALGISADAHASSSTLPPVA